MQPDIMQEGLRKFYARCMGVLEIACRALSVIHSQGLPRIHGCHRLYYIPR
jgi:hypothetical protein